MVPLPRLILSSRSLLPPWPPLTPPRVSFAHAGPSRRAPRSRSLRPAPVRDGEASTVRCRTQTKTHEGSGVTSRSLTVTVDGSFCPSLRRSSHPALFSSSATFLRRGARGPPRSFLPHVRLLLPFRMPPRCPRERVRLFSFFFSSCVSRLLLSSLLSSRRIHLRES